ncbi:MAG: zinc-binding alcohol dehydrogenase family protein [Lapillicoccus sp.]
MAVSVAPVVPLDLLCASGTSYFGPPTLPYVPGVQGVGRVLRSSTLDEGTRVWFSTSAGMAPGDGSLAETCVVAAADLVPLGEKVADEDAATIGLSGVAAWMCLTWRAALRPGERVLVLGAGGVVGQTAVASARRLGAVRVVGVCRSAAAEERVRRAGADAVVRMGDDDAADPAALAARLVEAAGGPVDVVVDPVFGLAAAAACLALASGGRLVNLGGLGGDAAQLSSAVLRGRSASVLAYTNNAITPEQRATALGKVLALAASGTLVVDRRVHPLDEVAAAWERAAVGEGVRPLVHLPDDRPAAPSTTAALMGMRRDVCSGIVGLGLGVGGARMTSAVPRRGRGSGSRSVVPEGV